MITNMQRSESLVETRCIIKMKYCEVATQGISPALREKNSNLNCKSSYSIVYLVQQQVVYDGRLEMCIVMHYIGMCHKLSLKE